MLDSERIPSLYESFDSLLARAREEPKGYELAAAALHGEEIRDRKFPAIYLIDTPDGSVVGGRYFPHYCAIVVYAHTDEEITAATILHELAHYATYQRKCGTHHWQHDCGYVGAHQRDFYEILERMHARIGITPAAARAVEHKYRYPNHWRSIESFA